jgi:hypothetical protein
MVNKWILHIKKTMRHMKQKGSYAKGKGLGQVIKEAKKTWKKGGGDDAAPTVTPTVTPTPTMGGRKTRKNKRLARK